MPFNSPILIQAIDDKQIFYNIPSAKGIKTIVLWVRGQLSFIMPGGSTILIYQRTNFPLKTFVILKV